MITDTHNTNNLKHFTLYNTINNTDNKVFYRNMDTDLVKKRFSNAYNLSINEHILKIDMELISSKTVIKIVSEFIKIYESKNILKKRNLYEILKISNLEKSKLEKLFFSDKILKLINALDEVSRETTLLSFDFLILRVYDNLIRKSPLKNELYNKLKDSHKKILSKIITTSYEKDEKECEINYLCWIDRLLSGLIDKEFSPEDYKNTCNKILATTGHTIYLYWKILNSVSYLLLQKEFSSINILRIYKKELEKIIEQKYTLLFLSNEELKKQTISILAKDFPTKEDFYYLFDLMIVTSAKSNTSKDFCLDLLQYIIHYDTKYNIFSYRFVRKYFIESVFKLINPNDDINTKNKELILLLKLFHTDHFYSFYKKDIFLSIINILKGMNINHLNTKLTCKNFYKFCDIVDYILYANNDLIDFNIVNFLCSNKENIAKVSKHFKLQKSIN